MSFFFLRETFLLLFWLHGCPRKTKTKTLRIATTYLNVQFKLAGMEHGESSRARNNNTTTRHFLSDEDNEVFHRNNLQQITNEK